MTTIRKLVLFDFDGTLADTAPDLAAAANKQRARRGLDPLPESELRPWSSYGARGLLKAALGVETTDPEFPALREQFLEDYEAGMTDNTTLFPGIRELLDTLKANGLEWGIVTNKLEYLAIPQAVHLGLHNDCVVTVGGDTTDHIKPHPAPLLHAAKKANVPIRIAHSHNTESEGNHLAKIYKWYMGNYVRRSATHLYACSLEAAKWLFGNRSNQVHILRNGIETDKFQYSPDNRSTIREELEIHDDTFVIGHVGRFSKQKNHLFLLDIFAKVYKELPNSILILVGDGIRRGEIIQRIRELNIQKQVKILGVRQDIPALLQAFDTFVFPSFHEGLPVTLVEAQGAGLPCVISDRITTEVDMNLGLVQSLALTDKSTWTDCIVNIARKRQARNISREALLEQGYDIKQIAKQTESSYLMLGEQAI